VPNFNIHFKIKFKVSRKSLEIKKNSLLSALEWHTTKNNFSKKLKIVFAGYHPVRHSAKNKIFLFLKKLKIIFAERRIGWLSTKK
jgi:hypothetical protein